MGEPEINLQEELKNRMGVDRRTEGLVLGSLTDSKCSSFQSSGLTRECMGYVRLARENK